MHMLDEVLRLFSLFSVPTLKFSQPLSVVVTPEKCQAGAMMGLILPPPFFECASYLVKMQHRQLKNAVSIGFNRVALKCVLKGV